MWLARGQGLAADRLANYLARVMASLSISTADISLPHWLYILIWAWLGAALEVCFKAFLVPFSMLPLSYLLSPFLFCLYL